MLWLVWKSTLSKNIDVQKDSTEGEAPLVSHKTLDGEVGSLENYGVKDREENPISRDNVLYSLGKHYVMVHW